LKNDVYVQFSHKVPPVGNDPTSPDFHPGANPSQLLWDKTKYTGTASSCHQTSFRIETSPLIKLILRRELNPSKQE